MNRRKSGTLIAVFALIFCLGPTIGTCNKPAGGLVTGEITATPVTGQIEVAHHTYRIRAGSYADRIFRSFSMGQVVDLVLDSPPSDKKASVVVITRHAGS
jgi:hypothetical protein